MLGLGGGDQGWLSWWLVLVAWTQRVVGLGGGDTMGGGLDGWPWRWGRDERLSGWWGPRVVGQFMGGRVMMEWLVWGVEM